MAKISNNIVNSATSNIASINLENAVDSKTESTASKLLNLFKKAQTERTNTSTALRTLMNYRDAIGQSFLYGSTAAYYNMLIKKSAEIIKNTIGIYNSTKEDSPLVSVYTSISQIIGDYFQTTDPETKKNLLNKIMNLLQELNTLLNSLQTEGIIPKNLTYNPSTDTVETEYATNISALLSNKYRIMYGKVENYQYIAQRANVSAIFYDNCNDSKKFYLSIPTIKVNNKEYTYTQYPPIDIWPLNLWWTDWRYCSAEFQVENPNAEKEDKSDMYLTVYSIVYFNGSRFFGSDEIKYQDIKEYDTDSIKILTQSDNSTNTLSGNVQYSREIANRTLNISFNYDDASVNPATRSATRISDAIDINITENGNTLPYSVEGNLSYDSDLSSAGDGTYYSGTLSITSEALNTATADIDSSVDSELATQIQSQYNSGISVQVICKVVRVNSITYNIEIYPDIDNSSNSAILESDDPADLIGLSFCSQKLENIRASKTVTIDTSSTALFRNMKQTEELQRMLESLLNGSNEYSQSDISSLLVKIINNINTISVKANDEIVTELSSISSYISTYTNIYTYLKTNDSYLQSTYFEYLYNLFVSFTSSIEKESATNISESNIVSVLNTNISAISNEVSAILNNALTVFSKLENISNNYESILPSITSTSTISSSITTWNSIINGNSLEASAYNSAGYGFKTIPLPMSIENYTVNSRLFIDNDSYIYYLLYILNIFQYLLKRDENYQILANSFREVSLAAYNKRFLDRDILDDNFVRVMTEYQDFKNEFNITVVDEPNKEFVSTGLTYKSNELEFYNNIDLSELLSNENLQSNIYRLLEYYKVGFYKPLVNMPASAMSNTIAEYSIVFANSKMNLRTLVAFHSFLSAINDIKNYAENSINKNEIINKNLVNIISGILKTNNTELTETTNAIMRYIKSYNALYGNSNLRVFRVNNGVFL